MSNSFENSREYKGVTIYDISKLLTETVDAKEAPGLLRALDTKGFSVPTTTAQLATFLNLLTFRLRYFHNQSKHSQYAVDLRPLCLVSLVFTGSFPTYPSW